MVPKLRPPLLAIATCRWRWVCSTGDRGNRSTRRRTLPRSNLFSINFTWIGLGSNPGRCGERPATNCLSLARLSAAWNTSNQHFNAQFLPQRKLNGPHYRKQENKMCGKIANIIINNQQNCLFLPRALSHKYCILSFKYKAFSTVCLAETGNL
jgi:hypothetical protein